MVLAAAYLCGRSGRESARGVAPGSLETQHPAANRRSPRESRRFAPRERAGKTGGLFGPAHFGGAGHRRIGGHADGAIKTPSIELS